MTVRSLNTGGEKRPESRFNGCPLVPSDVSARECWILLETLGWFVAFGFSDVRRLCNECDDRVRLGALLREDVKLGWWLLDDDVAQILSSQSLRLTTGVVPGSGGEGMHGQTELV